MRSSALLSALSLSLSTTYAAGEGFVNQPGYLAGKSSKRGLAYGTFANPSDNDIYNAAKTDLTWYYNFRVEPTKSIDQWAMQFVPMMWGNAAGDQGFDKKVEKLLDEGWNITYVLGFNEPDICSGGGSCLQAADAAESWKKNIEPLKKRGIKLGAPAVTGGDNTWLTEFFTACDGGCSTDFIPLHFYSDFVGLGEWVTNITTIYPNNTVWVTEFACPICDLDLTQQAFNQSLNFLDKNKNVERYSYFGAYREAQSNTFLGPNVAMLDNSGALTDLGVWYLGLDASYANKTEVGPAATKPANTPSPTTPGSSSASSQGSSSAASPALQPWILGTLSVMFWGVVFG